jgi:hypothetical protein
MRMRKWEVESELTFAMRNSELRMASSSSVPKMAEICDMGHGCHALTCGPLNHRVVSEEKKESVKEVPRPAEVLSGREVRVTVGEDHLARCDVCGVVLVEEAQVWEGEEGLWASVC